MLILNFFRDAWRTLPRLISVMAVTALGVTIFLGLMGLSANMQHTIDVYLNRAQMSDLWVSTDDADMRDVRALRAETSIRLVTPRVFIPTKWDGDENVTLNLYTYDEFTQNLPYVESGEYPSNARECMLAAKFANARGYKVGDEISVEYDERTLRFTVSALVIAPERLYNITGTQSMVNPAMNGFLYVPEEAVASTYGQYVYNQILIKAEDGVQPAPLISTVKAILGDTCLAITEFKDSAAYGIYTQRDSFISMAGTFASLCFLTAALIMFTTMQRIVESSRTMIGTLKALGYSELRISFYFIGYALMVAVLGSLLGIWPGQQFTNLFMGQFFFYYELPPINFYMDWSSFTTATVASVASCLGAVLISLVREVRTGPAECMRPKPPKKSRRNIVELTPIWLVLSFSIKAVVRNIFRNGMRALMCILGVSLCMALVVTGLGITDTLLEVMDDLFSDLYRYDMQVSLDGTASTREERHVERMSGVNWLESEMIVSIEAFAHGARLDTQMHVLADQPRLYVIEQSGLASMNMPGEGVYIGESFSEDMGLKLGDPLTFRPIGARKRYTLPVAGIAPNVDGVFAGRSLWRGLGESFRPNILYLAASNPPAFRLALEEHDFVEAVSMKSDIVESFEQNLQSNQTTSIILIASGGVLAFAVLYSLGIMNFYDRIRDLATLSVLGFYPKEIRQLILSENIVFTIFGIGCGALFGQPLLSTLMSDSGDSLTFVPVVYMTSYAIAALITLGFALLVNVFLGLKTRKIDMLGALKSVE